MVGCDSGFTAGHPLRRSEIQSLTLTVCQRLLGEDMEPQIASNGCSIRCDCVWITEHRIIWRLVCWIISQMTLCYQYESNMSCIQLTHTCVRSRMQVLYSALRSRWKDALHCFHVWFSLFCENHISSVHCFLIISNLYLRVLFFQVINPPNHSTSDRPQRSLFITAMVSCVNSPLRGKPKKRCMCRTLSHSSVVQSASASLSEALIWFSDFGLKL